VLSFASSRGQIGAETLHRGIAGSHLTVLDGARHFAPLERLKQAAAELSLLLQTMDRR
jgi:hypothetical protein